MAIMTSISISTSSPRVLFKVSRALFIIAKVSKTITAIEIEETDCDTSKMQVIKVFKFYSKFLPFL